MGHKQGEDGKQSRLCSRFSPQALLGKLKKGTAKRQSFFTATIQPEYGGLFVLERKHC